MLATLTQGANPSTGDLDPPAHRTPAVRVLPVPRSEPLTDDERRAAGLEAPPMTAQLLPLDLPTGAQVRRGPRWSGDAPVVGGARSRGEAAGAGRTAGDAGLTGTAPFRPSDDQYPSGEHALVMTTAGIATAGMTTAGHSSGGGTDAGPAPGLVPPGLGIDRTSTVDGIESADAIELRLATRRLLATCVEVVGGYRPIGQLRPFCLPERFDSIVNRLLRPAGGALGRGHGATRASVVAGHGGPPRAGRAAQTGPGDRVTVRRVQICDVSNGVAEIAVVMARRDKVWAMAMRMELARGRWQCTHLEVL